jgi:hypothetical protein
MYPWLPAALEPKTKFLGAKLQSEQGVTGITVSCKVQKIKTKKAFDLNSRNFPSDTVRYKVQKKQQERSVLFRRAILTIDVDSFEVEERVSFRFQTTEKLD